MATNFTEHTAARDTRDDPRAAAAMERDLLRAALLALATLGLLLLPFGGGGCAREAQSRPTAPAPTPSTTSRPAPPPSPSASASLPAGAGTTPADDAGARRAVDEAPRAGGPSTEAETVTLQGTAAPLREVTLAAEAAGRVEDVRVDVGDSVAADAPVARVDYEMLRARVRQARTAYRLARRSCDRLERLLATDAVSRQAVDEARARADDARSLLRIARVALDRATVRASLPGVVTRRHVEPGEYVNPGQPVVDVVDLSRVLVRVPVPESLAARVPVDATVPVRFDALGAERVGTTQVLVPTSDRASGTFELRVVVDNADGRVLGGMAASVTLDCPPEPTAARVAASDGAPALAATSPLATSGASR